MLARIITATIIFLAFIITLCPCAHSQGSFKCGKEFRIETQDGTTLQGKLLSNDGNVLALRHGASGLHTIALGDVASAYRVKRRTGMGILIGSLVGTGVGIMIGAVVYHIRESRENQDNARGWANLNDLGKEIRMGVLITVGSAIVGCVVGGIIGHNTQRLGPVQLEALPLCLSPSGDIIPLKVNLAINF